MLKYFHNTEHILIPIIAKRQFTLPDYKYTASTLKDVPISSAFAGAYPMWGWLE